MTLPICEKLLVTDFDPSSTRAPYQRLINPDGPEAADLIETLVERIIDARLFVDLVMMRARRLDDVEQAYEAESALIDIDAALALARGENTPGSEEMK